jgi:hypothetical protein
LPHGVAGWKNAPLFPRASLDRIDSLQGYEPHNIRFISYIANCAKNRFTDKDVIEFCKAVSTLPERGIISVEETDKPFLRHFSLAHRRARNKNIEFSITVEDLRQQWNKQGGACDYSGWKLDNPSRTIEWEGYPQHPRRASLDRIDSSKGYTKENVHFVSLIANYAKNEFTSEDLRNFCLAVVAHCNKAA